MRHREALVAYEQSNGTYNLHQSDRLGRNLHEAWRITELTPHGYSQIDEEGSVIESEPSEQGLSFQKIADHLDFARFGAVIVVSDTFEVTPYRALWFGFANSCAQVSVSDRVGNGALVSLAEIHQFPERDAAFCGRYSAMKRTLGGLVDDGILSLEVARMHLRTHVSFLDEDRDVVFASGSEPGGPDASQEAPATSIVDRLLGWK